MAEPFESLLNQLDDAISNYDREVIDVACAELIAWAWQANVSEEAAATVAQAVRKHRCWRALTAIASALIARGHSHPMVRSALVQSAVDGGELGLAQRLITRFLAQYPGDPELLGLEARVSKQAFVHAVESGAPRESVGKLLDEAFGRYVMVYLQTGLRWHGINAVALAMRADRDGIALSVAFDAKQVATEIMRISRERLRGPDNDAWDLAMVLESAIALGHASEALIAAAAFAAGNGDLFTYASNLRQLREIWELDERDLTKRAITSLLEAKVISLHGAANVALRADAVAPPTRSEARAQFARALEDVRPSFTTDVLKTRDDQPDSELERTFDGAFVKLDNLRRGLACADAVGWLANRNSGRRIGTGFIVKGELLDPRLGAEAVLVTNAHVLDRENAPLTPANALVGFESGALARSEFGISELLWSSPPKELDVAIARLSPSSQGGLGAFAPSLPSRNTRSFLYVIGHPAGGALSFSLMDNLLVDYDERLLHYRCATEPGSSGSPVLDEDWQLVGLHHAGRLQTKRLRGQPGAYGVNEGIRFDVISAAFRAAWAPRAER